MTKSAGDNAPATLLDLRGMTPARVMLGRSGAALPTQAMLAFTLDFAKARDAVHAALDEDALRKALAVLKLEAITVTSEATDRAVYLRRPDLGRKLDEASRAKLAEASPGICDVLLVLGDGLSPGAVNSLASQVVSALLPLLDEKSKIVAVVARGARVALADEIGAIVNAKLSIMLIGERPGLSAAESLGAYITFDPRLGRSDAERNCVSNIQPSGLTPEQGAARIAWLVREALARGLTGVALKDESGATARLPTRTSP